MMLEFFVYFFFINNIKKCDQVLELQLIKPIGDLCLIIELLNYNQNFILVEFTNKNIRGIQVFMTYCEWLRYFLIDCSFLQRVEPEKLLC